MSSSKKDSDESCNNLKDSADERKVAGMTRREILKKYGAYTAPVVVSMLAPKQAFAMFGGTTFDTVADCWAAHGHSPTFMMNHCPNMHRILN